ncbi:MAG: RagB/SusD family nutrient uptake outer membrane protein [Bacteroidales bacterium]|nr:RagB/SusD family nutrient uptake outer membrane protein [Bacteroidales bacterium]
MKKLLYITFAAALVAAASCSKLDKFPLSKMSEEKFFTTPQGLLAFSNTFYTLFPGGSSLYTEDADNYIQMVQSLEVRGDRTVPASGSGWSWSALRDINTLLDNVNRCEDATARKQYTAVAKFFRAYFYFEKVKRFGDVPWYDTQLDYTSKDLYKERDSRELVMQNILKDLDDAIEGLSETHSIYSVTKWTAMALKSRVCLFEGTFRKYHHITGYEHDWKYYLTECEKVSRTFISKSNYSIYKTDNPKTTYLDLFTAQNYAGTPLECEVILARDYNLEYDAYHSSNYAATTASMGRYGMTRKAVASYLNADGTRFTDTEDWETFSFAEEMQNRDPRLAQSIVTPGYTRLGGTIQLAPMMSATITGYQPIKYVTSEANDAYNKSDNDLILFRTAEVYLNFAEALAELEGAVAQADLDMSVNMLRDRVGITKKIDVAELSSPEAVDTFLVSKWWGGYQNVGETNKALILEIRRERSCELNQEGFRYYDIIRWKEGGIFNVPMYGMYFPGPGEYDLDGNGTPDLLLYSDTPPASSATYKFALEGDIKLSEKTKGMICPFRDSKGDWNEDRDYFYPIPTDELQLNTNLKQNPNWQ